MNKKIVWLPYDMDTAIGINNEGQLVFDYHLEDIDHLSGGAEVFNGQDSVMWNNVRQAFASELATMYKNLRSTGALSYAKVEQMFEEHQSKWPEAIFNEDSWFKYIDPLIEEGSGAYLPMMQGSKAEQRKWWLYNRFRYIDSKYNAGDALSDLIQIRGYAKSNVTVTPYADIYPTVKYGSYLVQARGERGTATTLVCPLDSVNDTEIYIYSASQLASVGDLSGFKVGFADFSMATRLQSIKIGDSSSSYENQNLTSLTLGNNVLLKTLDVRNCSALGTGDQKSVDISGCEIIEEVYFDGTAIQGLTLPNGGVLKKLHLPDTMTNLTILNQGAITEFVLDDPSSITTLRLENVSDEVDALDILGQISAGSRVRLIGIQWEADDADEIEDILDLLDTMRGLDEQGGNVDTAQVSGEIHTDSLTGAQIASFVARYSYINFTADHTSATISYYNGETLITTDTILDGGDATYSGSTPTKTQTAQYTYTFAGWSKTDDNTVDADALTHVTADRNVYACYTETLRTYTVTFVKASDDGGGTLQTMNNVAYGTSITAASSYTGSTPTTSKGTATDYPFEGWNPASATVMGDTVFTAKFGSPIEVAEITDSWDTIIANINNGTYANVYKVGNYKPLDLGTEGTINMQIVAIDGDELASGDNAPLTFVAIDLLNSPKYFTGAWEDSYIRNDYLGGTILNAFPSNVKARLQTVNKYTKRGYGGTDIGQEVLWIPSNREVLGQTENNGISYAIFTNSVDNRKKAVSGSTAVQWWVRSFGTGSDFHYCITGNGTGTTLNGSNYNSYICLGFCLGLQPETITDSWSTILANTNYATDYSIGDTKYLDLGTEGKHLMEIVAINEDNRADGNGKAGLTWISKDLLPTEYTMNSSSATTGGWANSGMRAYLQNTIKPLIPSDVRSALVSVTKISADYANDAYTTQTTTDDVWIPSLYEINLGSDYESTGATYSSKFNSNSNRIKQRSGSNATWWLRTPRYGSRFFGVHSDGSMTYTYPNNDRGIALGFCTN